MAEPASQRFGYETTLSLVTSLCLTYTIGVVLVRAWVRRSIFGVDDLIILLAVVVSLTIFTSTFGSIHLGLGKPWNVLVERKTMMGLNGLAYTIIVTFVTSLYLSKCAVLVFLMRLNKQRRQQVMYRAFLAVIGVFGVASVFLVTINRPLKSGFYWGFHLNGTSCKSQTTPWKIFTAFDILTEMIVIILPTTLVLSTQMPPKRKAAVISAFYLRVPVIALSIGRQIFTEKLCSSSSDVGLDSAVVTIWLQIETSFAIVSSTFSALKAFTSDFNSSWGLRFTLNAGPEDYTLSRGATKGASVIDESGTGTSGFDEFQLLKKPGVVVTGPGKGLSSPPDDADDDAESV